METEKTYTITESQLQELINKLHRNILSKANRRGECSLGSSINDSTRDTIQNFLDKNCLNLENGGSSR